MQGKRGTTESCRRSSFPSADVYATLQSSLKGEYHYISLEKSLFPYDIWDRLNYSVHEEKHVHKLLEQYSPLTVSMLLIIIVLYKWLNLVWLWVNCIPPN